MLRKTFTCRRLYLGGGNARLVVKPLARGTRVVRNIAGVLGCIELWRAPRGSRATRALHRAPR